MRQIIVILGPTAAGKSALGVALAKKFKGVVVSADSRQVYRGLNIGTAKITRLEMKGVPHFLLDVASPHSQYSVACYVREFNRIIKYIPAHQPIFLVGGSPFYIKAVTTPGAFSLVPPNPKLRRRLESQSTKQLLNQLTKLDPDRARSVDTANRRRLIRAIEIASAPLKPSDSVDNQVPFQILKIGIIISRRELYQRIDQRIKSRVDRIITETKNLHLQGLSWRRLEAFGLEYRFASRLLRGQLTRSEMVYQLKNSTHDFARRQLTWWRREVDIHWCRNQTAASQKIKTFLKKTGRG